MKKDLAAFRYLDEKILHPFIADTAGPSSEAIYHGRSVSWAALATKRIIDIVSALFVIVFGFPFYLFIAALIKLTSKGSVLYVQERIGQHGKPFKFYKFRTMLRNSDDSLHREFTRNFINGEVLSNGSTSDGSAAFKLMSDPRVTPIGRFLRRSSLDELPQFINVLRGEMSLVGPRPPLRYELDQYKEWHKGRLMVKPGLTGLWQVSGRSRVPFEEMVKLDLYYIENWSLILDLKIILRTIPVMFSGFGAY